MKKIEGVADVSYGEAVPGSGDQQFQYGLYGQKYLCSARFYGL
jgi:hypothetical protein